MKQSGFTLRTWLSRKFSQGLGIFLLVQGLILGLGMPLVLDQYAQHQHDVLVNQARSIILNGGNPPDPSALPSGPFFVFMPNGELLYSNRGQGRSIPRDSLSPVRWEGHIIGSVYVGSVDFFAQEANQRFMVAMGILFLMSAVVALLAGQILGRHNARIMGTKVGTLRTDIAGVLDSKVPPARDLTIRELTTISQDLHGLATTLDTIEQTKRKFLQDLGHDLRTPLAGLKAQLEALEDRVLEPSPSRFLVLQGEVQRVSELAHSLTQLYEAQSGQVPKPRWVRCYSVLSGLEVRFHQGLATRGISFSWNLETQEIWVDEGLLDRILGNLMGNSLTHGVDAMDIRIEIRPMELDGRKGRELSFLDTGPGVDTTELEKIFDRMYRTDPARTKPGSGLGLSIVQALVRQHGGLVRAEGLLPHGLVIRLWFPDPVR